MLLLLQIEGNSNQRCRLDSYLVEVNSKWSAIRVALIKTALGLRNSVSTSRNVTFCCVRLTTLVHQKVYWHAYLDGANSVPIY